LFFIESLLEVSFGRFTDRRLSYILPELSNSWSLPSKAGGLSVIIKVDFADMPYAKANITPVAIY
jgi:hypothetical protein